MAIPDYQAIMLPLLRHVEDKREYRVRDINEAITRHFELTEEERRELLPSGKVRVIVNRVGWARFYLVRAALLEAPQRGVVRITERGRDLLARSPASIDNSTLRQFPEFVEFLDSKKKPESDIGDTTGLDTERTPDEILEDAHETLRNALASEVLMEVKQATPGFFENLVVELLGKMGYGDSIENAGQVVGGSGDGGIDGIIKQDQLGLDVIYIQAKRWTGPVGRPEIHKFVGALHGQRARKGVFITTSRFTQDAVDYASSVESSVVLMDGRALAEWMLQFDVGVSTVETYTKKKLDTDYFVEE